MSVKSGDTTEGDPGAINQSLTFSQEEFQQKLNAARDAGAAAARKSAKQSRESDDDVFNRVLESRGISAEDLAHVQKLEDQLSPHDRLKKDHERLKKQHLTEVEGYKKTIAEQSEIINTGIAKSSILTAATEADAVYPEQIWSLIGSHVEVVKGGEVKIRDSEESVKDYVAKYLQQYPNLKKPSNPEGGGGALGGGSSGGSNRRNEKEINESLKKFDTHTISEQYAKMMGVSGKK